MAIKEIYLIRHGVTDANVENRLNGSGCDSHLNDKGLQQAEFFFNTYQDYPFDKVYLSTMIRTYQTVRPFIRQNLPYEKWKELNEISWGIYDGNENKGLAREAYLRCLASWDEGDFDAAIEGGESASAVARRVQLFRQHLLTSLEKRVLVCTHGRTLRILICTLMGLSLHHMKDFPHHNLGLYKIHLGENGADLVIKNRKLASGGMKLL